MAENLEILWENLLSRQPERVREAFNSLGKESQASVIAHLKHMSGESGWHTEQRLSALAALEALNDVINQSPIANGS